MDGAEIGAGEHTDYGNLTILATDGVAGLQVRRRDGVWLDAPHIDGAFVCNIGDCLMRWTNDVYVSTPHRVLRPRQERYSVALLLGRQPRCAGRGSARLRGAGRGAALRAHHLRRLSPRTADRDVRASQARQLTEPAMALDLIIRNATLPDDRTGLDIGVSDGTIVAVGPRLDAEAATVIDAEGQLLSPPFVDPPLPYGCDALARHSAHQPLRHAAGGDCALGRTQATAHA